MRDSATGELPQSPAGATPPAERGSNPAALLISETGFVSIEEAAKKLGVCEDTVQLYLNKGLLKGTRKPAPRKGARGRWEQVEVDSINAALEPARRAAETSRCPELSQHRAVPNRLRPPGPSVGAVVNIPRSAKRLQR